MDTRAGDAKRITGAITISINLSSRQIFHEYLINSIINRLIVDQLIGMIGGCQ